MEKFNQKSEEACTASKSDGGFVAINQSISGY